MSAASPRRESPPDLARRNLPKPPAGTNVGGARFDARRDRRGTPAWPGAMRTARHSSRASGMPLRPFLRGLLGDGAHQGSRIRGVGARAVEALRFDDVEPAAGAAYVEREHRCRRPACSRLPAESQNVFGCARLDAEPARLAIARGGDDTSSDDEQAPFGLDTERFADDDAGRRPYAVEAARRRLGTSASGHLSPRPRRGTLSGRGRGGRKRCRRPADPRRGARRSSSGRSYRTSSTADRPDVAPMSTRRTVPRHARRRAGSGRPDGSARRSASIRNRPPGRHARGRVRLRRMGRRSRSGRRTLRLPRPRQARRYRKRRRGSSARSTARTASHRSRGARAVGRPQPFASPTESAITAPRCPSGCLGPVVLSRAVWCSNSELISPPTIRMIIEIQIQVMKPMIAPSDP